MTQAAIRKLVADKVATALETQAATMENTNNPNRNSGLRSTPIERKCTYEKFMSSQPFYFNGMEGATKKIMQKKQIIQQPNARCSNPNAPRGEILCWEVWVEVVGEVWRWWRRLENRGSGAMTVGGKVGY
nr:hypothetical protein [Tanacetum cinerariifolium]